jgi:multidrug efflux pump subunit AcrA (membrane-fusion protein)
MRSQLLQRIAQPNILVGITSLLAIFAVAVVFAFTGQKPTESYISPTQGPLAQEVDMTGTVKAADTLDLSFESGGRIAYISGIVGTHVDAGSTLAALSTADLKASLEQAQAALQMQQAKLDGIKVGTRPESIAVAQAGVSAAQTALSQAKQSVVQAAQDAYVKSDDARDGKRTYELAYDAFGASFRVRFRRFRRARCYHAE